MFFSKARLMLPTTYYPNNRRRRIGEKEHVGATCRGYPIIIDLFLYQGKNVTRKRNTDSANSSTEDCWKSPLANTAAQRAHNVVMNGLWRSMNESQRGEKVKSRRNQ